MSFTPTPWPTLPLPRTRAEVEFLTARLGGPDKLQAWFDQREEWIVQEQRDPIHYGYEPPHWTRARALLAEKSELLILGGNRSGKTTFTGKVAVELLLGRRGSRVACFHTSEQTSITIQQPILYRHLPPALRDVGKAGKVTNIRYSQKGGFTEATFVLPPETFPIGQPPWWGAETEMPYSVGQGSQCFFFNYGQYEKDPNAFEGGEFDVIVLDEICPPSLLQTLRLRKGPGRIGKIVITYTPKDGYDNICRDLLDGAVPVETFPNDHRLDRFATGLDRPLLSLEETHVQNVPAGHMPYQMQPVRAHQGVIFFWTAWNAYLTPAMLDELLSGLEKPKLKIRGFGWAEKLEGNKFPRFNPAVHVIAPEKVPREGTDYMSDDPALARSHFLLWCRVDEFERKFVFDESPRASEGEWVTLDGAAGEGQRVFAGRGTDFYKEYIREREAEHAAERGLNPAEPWVEARSGDPRAFATPAAAAQGGMNLMELFAQDPDPMYFRAAPIRQTVLLDVEIINDWLSWDEDKPLSVENEPRLYISSRCQNLIKALLNWSGKEDPWKDPVDALRYLAVLRPQYCDPNVPVVVGGGGW